MENSSTPAKGPNSGRSAIDTQRSTLQQAAHDTLDQWQQKGEEARAQLAPKLEAARENAKEWQSQAEATVRDRPWIALGIAAVAGILVAKLLS